MKRVMKPGRRRAAMGTAALAAALLVPGCTSHSRPPAGEPPGTEKVFVCHKGKKTLTVAAPALDAHLRHGDTRGPCR